MTEKLTKTISGIFVTIWFIITFTEYLRYNPDYPKALQFFQYGDLLILLLLLGFGANWIVTKSKKKQFNFINGLSFFGGLLLIDTITMILFYGKIESLNLDALALFAHLGHFVGVAFCIFLIYMVCRVLGMRLTTLLPPKIAKLDMPVIQAALGIMTITLVLFFLGILGLLNVFIIAPILVLILVADWRNTLQTLKSTLLKPIKIIKSLNLLGVFSFLFLGVFLTFNFVQNLRPFPAGTDSLNLYVNLSQLIADYGALPAGHQPYNWSLFTSLGTVVFGRIDVVLGLTFLGVFLTLTALFRLSRKWLDVNASALCLLLFYMTPMVNFLSYRDMKVDMGLLFITLAILLIFYNWVMPPKISKPKSIHPFFNHRIPTILKENHLLILIGLLSGFAFGVKLTILFFFFAIVAAVWYSEAKILGFVSVVLLIFAATFLLQLDAHPLLRDFHKSVSALQWILLGLGLISTGYLFVKQKEMTLDLMKKSLILCGFFLLPILPWLSKNVAETGSFTIESLLNGKKATPELDLKKMNQLLSQGDK